ncbi:MAG: hypothetical protein K2P34_07270, partial [Lachnospiraceae bacterium]|nr:hypothetical protein [Lachnospiraceae bacterium]
MKLSLGAGKFRKGVLSAGFKILVLLLTVGIAAGGCGRRQEKEVPDVQTAAEEGAQVWEKEKGRQYGIED